MDKHVAAIICAAGSSSRFGGKRKKPFVDVAGRAAFLRSVELFTDRDDVKQVILAIDPDDEEIVHVKWGANLKFFGVQICFGGKERFDTVQKALEHIKEDIQLVAVHDAARCCITDDLVSKVLKIAGEKGAAILASPLVGTIKEVVDGTIQTTVDRTHLYEAQTPQVFELTLLKKAYENLKKLDTAHISDDAQLIEALGESVAVVQSDPSNIKITYPSDVAITEAIIKSRPKAKSEGPIGPYHEAQW
jgi:2-C-methyl-D-erythritol 4-phosphate cytidylyltransferase